MAPDQDAASRLKVRLDTTRSEHYDEVVALTERIINENFEALHNLYPEELGRVVESEYMTGSIDAWLEPSKIILPTNTQLYGSNTVLYQVRFKKGTLQDPMGTRSIALDGWELCVPCQLGLTEIDKKTKKVIDGTELSVVQAAGRKYAYPGDYSVERLFAQLATAKWLSPDVQFSKVIDEKKQTMSLETWSRNESDMWSFLVMSLIKWGTANQRDGRSTLNVSFKLPPNLVNTAEPTYVPTYVRQQVYLHLGRDLDHSKPTPDIIKEAKEAEKKRLEDKSGSASGTGLNCLLWCEMVEGNNPPNTPDLAWTGNFVTEEMGLDKAGAVDGTFALSYQLFFEKHLLPRLLPFNQACDIANLKMRYEKENSGYTAYWDYSVGHDKDHSSCVDDVFAFQRKENPPGSPKPTQYIFSKHNKDWEKKEDQAHNYDDKQWHWRDHWSEAKVTVEWIPGSNAIDVAGKTAYQYESKWSDNEELTKTTTHLFYKYYINWNFSIVLKNVLDGTIAFEIMQKQGTDGPASLEVRNDPFIKDNPSVPRDQAERIKKYFGENIKTCLNRLPTDLKAQLDSSAKFTYPGTGTFNFSKPIINDLGNVLAQIQYNPLIKNEEFVRVGPKVIVKKPTVPVVKEKVTTVDTGRPIIKPKLSWTLSPALLTATSKAVKVSLIGKNNTGAAIVFGFISIKFTSGSSGPTLFGADQINGIWYTGTEPTAPIASEAKTPEKAASKGTGQLTKPATSITSTLRDRLGLGASSRQSAPPQSSEELGNTNPAPVQAEVSTKPDQTDDFVHVAASEKTEGAIAASGNTAASSPEKPTGATATTGGVTSAARSSPTPEVAKFTGTITPTASSTETQIKDTIRPLPLGKTEHGAAYWDSAILPADPKKANYFIVPASASVTFDFVIDTGLPSQYGIAVREVWKDPAYPTKTLPGLKAENDDWVLDVTLDRK